MSVPVFLDGGLVTTKSSHLWMIYFPRDSYHDSGKIGFKVIGYGGLGMEVKICGYRWVCKQDLQEFILAKKCKILAIEDETQPQPQPQLEQELFISQVITTSQRY